MVKLSNTDVPASKSDVKGNGRKILLILAVIFLLPFTVAVTLHLLQVKPSGHSYGDLVKPPLNLNPPVLHDVRGKPFGVEHWQKKWSIVMIDVSGCAEVCQDEAHMLKQVHASLGKEAPRVQRILLIPAEIKSESLNALLEGNPDLIVLTGADVDTIRFASEFESSGQPAGRIYLVDPLGNLMMTYSEKKDPKGLRSDLTRLLKNSWAG